jgi:hypothetical protein
MINALQYTRLQLRVFIMITLMCIIPNINYADAATTTSITGGTNHTCALLSGYVWCWGKNDIGQLGNGTTTDSYGATRVRLHTGALLDKVSAIDSYADTTCALRYGVVYCWGGFNPPYRPNFTRATPLKFSNGSIVSNVSKLAIGYDTSCALRSKQVWCWDNPLDNNSMALVKTKSGVLNNVSDISHGMFHACAIVSGFVWCWGSNYNSALGSGTSIYERTYADRVVSSAGGYLNNVRLLSAAGVHTCTVRNDNSIWCWGSNENHELGDRTTIERNKAVKHTELYRVGRITRISSGHRHSCILADQKVTCWGLNNFGQAYYNQYSTDFQNSNVLSVDTGTLHTCAIKTNAVWCWGNNSSGALGDGTINSNYQPPSLVVYANFRPFR